MSFPFSHASVSASASASRRSPGPARRRIVRSVLGAAAVPALVLTCGPTTAAGAATHPLPGIAVHAGRQVCRATGTADSVRPRKIRCTEDVVVRSVGSGTLRLISFQPSSNAVAVVPLFRTGPGQRRCAAGIRLAPRASCVFEIAFDGNGRVTIHHNAPPSGRTFLPVHFRVPATPPGR
jgi:hypothetical protein